LSNLVITVSKWLSLFIGTAGPEAGEGAGVSATGPVELAILKASQAVSASSDRTATATRTPTRQGRDVTETRAASENTKMFTLILTHMLFRYQQTAGYMA
jgi:hypothetical protein